MALLYFFFDWVIDYVVGFTNSILYRVMIIDFEWIIDFKRGLLD